MRLYECVTLLSCVWLSKIFRLVTHDYRQLLGVTSCITCVQTSSLIDTVIRLESNKNVNGSIDCFT